VSPGSQVAHGVGDDAVDVAAPFSLRLVPAALLD
jgi:hypothetical protein